MTTTPKRLLVLRHAKSAWDDPTLADFDRPLAARGRGSAPLVAGYISRKNLRPDLVLCSQARRAVETWEIVGPAFDPPVPVKFEKGLYLATPGRLLARLRRLSDDVSTAMVVGHNPELETVARQLSGDGARKARQRLAEKFPTAALAVIRLPVAKWSEIADGIGFLERFVTPKSLDKGRQ